jgi:cytochrome P450
MLHPIPPAIHTATFYDMYTAIQHDPNLSPKQRIAAEIALLEQWIGDPRDMCISLLDHPEDAILPTPLGTFVCKFRDVTEVLDRDDVFQVGPGYGERMQISAGDFMLGMDRGAKYDRENALIRLAMPPSDLPAMRAWVRSFAEGVVGQIAATQTSIDIVPDIGFRIPTGFVGQFMGIPGPSQEAWVTWQQMLGIYIFNYWSMGSPYKEEGSAMGLKYQTYINDTIRQWWGIIAGGGDAPDNLMTRLIRRAIADPDNNLDEIAIRRNLGGMSLGSTIAPSCNIIFALDYIIGLNDSDPATFAIIQRAAEDDDIDLLQNCVQEACRLRMVMPPSLFRISNADYEVASGTPRAKTIPAGTAVVLIPGAAMMDGETIDDPDTFKIDRPAWTYIMYGDGMHVCLGREIGKVLLSEAVRAVLRLPGVRRAEGPAGTLTRGTGLPGAGYPAHMVFDFDAAGAR